jgi:hypothetical protein
MKTILAFALAATTTFGASAVSAQSIDLGPGGPSVDLRSDRARERDRDRREMRRDQERDRDREVSRRGDTRCREVTIRERDQYGNTETRRREDCR